MSKINFNLNQIQAIAFDVDGVLSPSLVPMDHNGIPQRMANLHDGYAIMLAVKAGIKVAIISGADTRAVAARFRNIGVKDIFLGVTDKLPVFQDWISRRGINPACTVFVGDDIPDIPSMRNSALSVAPADAAVDVRAIADYISTRNGGCGVARELIEEILKAKGKWPVNGSAAYG